MPDFNEYEQSVAQSSPVEGYKFIGSFKTYRYTSADRDIIIGGETYTPISISRSNVKAGTQEEDDLALDVEIPLDTEVIIDYAYAEVPPTLTLEVYRLQSDDETGTAWSLYWTGEVRGFDVQGRTARVQAPSIFSLALQNEAPSVMYQTPCNVPLYSSLCGVNRADHRFDAVVLAVLPTSITLTTEPTTTNDLKAGVIVNLRNGERRLILANGGQTITIGYPFVDILAGDDVEVVRGCDHKGRLGDCKNKFDNYINYKGYEDIPPDTPFEGEIA